MCFDAYYQAHQFPRKNIPLVEKGEVTMLQFDQRNSPIEEFEAPG